MNEARGVLAQRIAGLSLAALGVVVWVESRDLTVMEEGVPGPGLLPAVVAGSLVVLGVALALRARAEAGLATAGAALDRRARRKVGLAAVCFAAYVAIVPAIGYTPATLVFCFALLSAVMHYSLLQRVLASVGVTLLMYLVFEVMLGVGLPGAEVLL
jgi:putative tricarboxylic transport membrane protein